MSNVVVLLLRGAIARGGQTRARRRAGRQPGGDQDPYGARRARRTAADQGLCCTFEPN